MKPYEMRDQLLRATRYFGQNKTIECVGLAVMVLRDLGDNSATSEVAGALRELMNLLGNDAVVKEILGKPLTFSTGHEKIVLAGLTQVFKVLMANKDKEDHATIMARKLKIDRYFNDGMCSIREGRMSDAVQDFDEAFKYYKDEHSLFILVGKAFMDAGAPRRAFPYLARGVIAVPNDEHLKILYEQCMAIKDKK